MIIVALGLMMDASEPGRYFRDVTTSRSRKRVVFRRNLARSDYYKRHANRAVWSHLCGPNRYVVSEVKPPLRAA